MIEQRLFFITTSSRLQKVFFNPITSFSSSVYVADGKSTCPPPPKNVLRAQMLLLFLHAGRKKTFQSHRPVSTWKSFCCRPLLPSTSSLICQGFSAHSGFSYNSAQTVGEWAQNGTAAAAPEDRRTDGHADSVHPGRWDHSFSLLWWLMFPSSSHLCQVLCQYFMQISPLEFFNVRT